DRVLAFQRLEQPAPGVNWYQAKAATTLQIVAKGIQQDCEGDAAARTGNHTEELEVSFTDLSGIGLRVNAIEQTAQVVIEPFQVLGSAGCRRTVNDLHEKDG